MSEYGAVAECTRAPFHAALKPAHNVAGGDLPGHDVKQRFMFQFAIAQVGLLEIGLDARVGKLWAEIRVLHHKTARLSENGMVNLQSCSDRQPFIAGGRLNPGAAKWGVREKLSIGHAVERASARHGEVFTRHTLVELAKKMEEHIFEAPLHGVGKIHFALSDFGAGLTRLTESLHHPRRKMVGQTNRSVRQNLHSLIASQRIEETGIEIKAAISQADYFTERIAEPVLAIGREPHDLAFISVLWVADEFANHGVETAERIGQENTIEHFDVIAFASGHHGRNEVSGAVVAEARGLLPG